MTNTIIRFVKINKHFLITYFFHHRDYEKKISAKQEKISAKQEKYQQSKKNISKARKNILLHIKYFLIIPFFLIFPENKKKIN
jgi:hypothetical protein